MNQEKSTIVVAKPKKGPPKPLVVPPDNQEEDDPAQWMYPKHNRLVACQLSKLMPKEWPQVMKWNVNPDHLVEPWS